MLIVGAGPIGCALAVDLRLRGVRCVIVERDEGISYDMRAMNNSVRTMEHIRVWGIAEQIRRCSRVPPEFRHAATTASRPAATGVASRGRAAPPAVSSGVPARYPNNSGGW